jgi:hypothetical protein
MLRCGLMTLTFLFALELEWHRVPPGAEKRILSVASRFAGFPDRIGWVQANAALREDFREMARREY